MISCGLRTLILKINTRAKLGENRELLRVLLCLHAEIYAGFVVETTQQQDNDEYGFQAARSIIRFRDTSTK